MSVNFELRSGKTRKFDRLPLRREDSVSVCEQFWRSFPGCVMSFVSSKAYLSPSLHSSSGITVRLDLGLKNVLPSLALSN